LVSVATVTAPVSLGVKIVNVVAVLEYAKVTEPPPAGQVVVPPKVDPVGTAAESVRCCTAADPSLLAIWIVHCPDGQLATMISCIGTMVGAGLLV
jgi:hypothetical protein